MSAPAGNAWLQRVRQWLKPPRRLRLLRPGGLLIGAIFGLGFATLNTGNNLLYLLLGALLGLIALSGWLSEQSLRGLRIERHLPGALTAGEGASILYTIHNSKRSLPSFLLTLSEQGFGRRSGSGAEAEGGSGAERGRGAEGAPLPHSASGHGPASAAGSAPLPHSASGHGPASAAGSAPLPHSASASAIMIPASGELHTRARLTFPRRGEYALDEITLTTTFPFGLFAKERDVTIPANVLVRPPTTRRVRALRPAGRAGTRAPQLAMAAVGAERGEFRGLRPYRSGDDPRDVHWRSSARTGEPIVREYDREQGRAYWLCLASAQPEGAAAEVAVEIVAALAAAAVARNDMFGFSGGGFLISQGSGPAQLDRVLDALARVRFSTPVRLPAARADCIWVSAAPAADKGFADVFVAGVDG